VLYAGEGQAEALASAIDPSGDLSDVQFNATASALVPAVKVLDKNSNITHRFDATLGGVSSNGWLTKAAANALSDLHVVTFNSAAAEATNVVAGGTTISNIVATYASGKTVTFSDLTGQMMNLGSLTSNARTAISGDQPYECLGAIKNHNSSGNYCYQTIEGLVPTNQTVTLLAYDVTASDPTSCVTAVGVCQILQTNAVSGHEAHYDTLAVVFNDPTDASNGADKYLGYVQLGTAIGGVTGTNRVFFGMQVPTGCRISRVLATAWLCDLNPAYDDLFFQVSPKKFALTVSSAQGGTWPGTVLTNWNATLTESVTNSPLAHGATTQYVCTGWTLTGNEPPSGLGTNVTLTLTNDAALTWNWTTQYDLTVSGGTGGSVACSNGWYNSGSSTSLTAVAASGYMFERWDGEVAGCATDDNVITVEMTRARSIAAIFRSLTTVILFR